VSAPVRPSDSAVVSTGNCNGSTPMPIRLDRWRAEDYAGLFGRAPVVVAATLLRDAGVRRDDACVLAARIPS
ncbi:hypothetical protein AB0K29_03680, partial [Micromonospora humida]